MLKVSANPNNNDVDLSSIICFINLEKFREQQGIPHNPSCLEDTPDLLTNLSEINREESLLILLSHNWLRGHHVLPHPDDEDNHKFQLCIEGIDKIWKSFAPGMRKCFVWIDFSCLNQTSSPADAIIKYLRKIVSVCDLIFTPIYDETWNQWSLPSNIQSLFKEYKAPGWNQGNYSYLNRAWCRLEMFYAANLPVENSELRLLRFDHALQFHAREGRRPHLLYGSRESNCSDLPRVLAPMQHSNFIEYRPEEGEATKKDTDIDIIKRLVDEVAIKSIITGYEGALNAEGRRHGYGKETFSDGTRYEGYYVNGCREGFGVMTYLHGDIHKGDWKNGRLNGYALFIFSDGGTYRGNCKDGLMDGFGIMKLPDVFEYEGEWKDGLKHGYGILTFAKKPSNDGSNHIGEKYVGNFQNDQYDGDGTMTYRDGSWLEMNTKWRKGKPVKSKKK
eukprot:gene4738-6646_t